MQMHSLDLESRQEVSEALRAVGIHLSEFCFPNLYFFREAHDYKIIKNKDSILIIGKTYDGKKYVMPLHNPNEATDCCFETLNELISDGIAEIVFPVPEEWLNCFPEEKFNVSYLEEDSDYLYLTEMMQTYPGKKRHKKRNLKSQFLKHYTHEYKELNEENLNDAKYLLELWQNASEQPICAGDYHPCLEALTDMKGYSQTGMIFYADNKPCGFLMGEPLNSETFTIHFAKADISFKGVYSFMFSKFCETMVKDYKYINMEQDLGKPGLKRTKKSYVPDLMAHKYRIELK